MIDIADNCPDCYFYCEDFKDRFKDSELLEPPFEFVENNFVN